MKVWGGSETSVCLKLFTDEVRVIWKLDYLQTGKNVCRQPTGVQFCKVLFVKVILQLHSSQVAENQIAHREKCYESATFDIADVLC